MSLTDTISGRPAGTVLSIAGTISGKLKPFSPGVQIFGSPANTSFVFPTGNTFDLSVVTFGLLTNLDAVSMAGVISGAPFYPGEQHKVLHQKLLAAENPEFPAFVFPVCKRFAGRKREERNM